MPDKSGIAPRISVIIPSYNSERTIRCCLKAVINQSASIPFDITVIDSSTDQTPQIIEREFPSIRLIHLETRTLAGAARNLGVQTTKAPLCLMIDSDCVAESDVIERFAARHRDGDYAAVAGALANGTPRSLSGWVGYLIEFREFIPGAPMRLERSMPTANIAYRREIFERYGYFEEDLWPAEDLLFNWKLYSAGERLLFDPAIKVTHLNRTGWKEVLSHQIRLGRTSAVARKRGGLPGGILLKYPPLILLMPLVRLLRAFKWFAKHDKRLLLRFLLILPAYLLATSFWSFGFLAECRKKALDARPVHDS
jgi:glycosyltransferase involved in cell wall biosynthesis